MSALAFDPWAGLKCKAEDAPSAEVANVANRDGREASGLARLAGLARVASSPCETPHPSTEPSGTDDDPPPLPVVRGLPDVEWVEAMAEALAANPVNRITDRPKALLYYRGRALAMLDATPDPLVRGLLLGWERHRAVGASFRTP
jgi:hypothetical protein